VTDDPTSLSGNVQFPREHLRERFANIEKLCRALRKLEPHIEPALRDDGTRVLVIGDEEVSIEELSPKARKSVDELEHFRVLVIRLLALLE
jgi:hypothetical protein